MTFARTASILAILPLHTMWLIGVPAGIWALIVLSRLDTKAAFQVHAVPIWSRVLTWLAGAIVVMCVIFAALIVLYGSLSAANRPIPPSPAPAFKTAIQVPTPTFQSGWLIGRSGPVLTDAFAQSVLSLQPHQVAQVNKILQSIHAESLALEARHTERQIDDAGTHRPHDQAIPGSAREARGSAVDPARRRLCRRRAVRGTPEPSILTPRDQIHHCTGRV